MARATAKKEESTELTVKDQALATMFGGEMQGSDTDDRGSEGVTSRDIQIPRIDLLQDLSPQTKEDEDAYIEGAKPGLLFNSLTGEIYGKDVIIVPIFYAFVFNIWIERKAGGGFRGSYPTEAEAKAKIPELAEQEDLREKDFQIVETALNYVFVVNGQGKIEEASMAFAKTKLSASRKLNALVRQIGGARWRRGYQVTAVSKKNAKGSFYVPEITPIGFTSPEIFAKAEETYELFSKSFKEGKLNTNFDDPDNDPDNDVANRGRHDDDNEI